jgi:hypothetical protein
MQEIREQQLEYDSQKNELDLKIKEKELEIEKEKIVANLKYKELEIQLKKKELESQFRLPTEKSSKSKSEPITKKSQSSKNKSQDFS